MTKENLAGQFTLVPGARDGEWSYMCETDQGPSVIINLRAGTIENYAKHVLQMLNVIVRKAVILG